MANALMEPKTYAKITGLALAAVALLGIVLSAMGDGGRFGLFCSGGAMTCDGEAAEGSFLGFDWGHNIVHVVLAAVALGVGFAASAPIASLYAKVFGIVYAALGVAGFFVKDLGLLHLELGENLVHLLIGGWGIVVGFMGAPANMAPAPAARRA